MVEKVIELTLEISGLLLQKKEVKRKPSLTVTSDVACNCEYRTVPRTISDEVLFFPQLGVV